MKHLPCTVNFVFIRNKATLKNQLDKTSVSNPVSKDSFWYVFNCLLYMYYLYKLYKNVIVNPHICSVDKYLLQAMERQKGNKFYIGNLFPWSYFLFWCSKPFYADSDHPFWNSLLKHKHRLWFRYRKRCYFIFTSNGKRLKSDNTYQSQID